jgi:hypothetical protein
MPWSSLLAPTKFGQSILCATNCKSAEASFNVIDDYNREALGIEVGFSLPSERIIRVLDQIIA